MFIGSDYIYPKTANRIIPTQVIKAGGTVLGELYLPLGIADASGRFIVQEDFGVIDPIPWYLFLTESAGQRCDHSKKTLTWQDGLRP